MGVAMEEECFDSILFYASIFEGLEIEEEEEEDDFLSCCEGDDLEEKNEPVGTCSKANNDDYVDDFSVRIYFKGVSAASIVDSCSGLSGIGVVMEGNPNSSPILVQKKLDFFVNESVANYLALMDGLIEAKQNKFIKVFAFTDSESLYDQINHNKFLEDSILVALKERILEHIGSFESFTLELLSCNDLLGALELAQVAIGLVSYPLKDNESIETCSICCEEKLASMMITLKCSHRFCSHCMKTYVEKKLESLQVPIRCPEHRCMHCLTMSECKTFLTSNTYHKLEKALFVAKPIQSDTVYCPLYQDDEVSKHVESEASRVCKQWCWGSYDSLSLTMDVYSDEERSEQAVIDSFFAGNFSLSNENDYEVESSQLISTDTCADVMKDLQELPWLERFVSLIDDTYNEEYL